jgi:hypothetical protein
VSFSPNPSLPSQKNGGKHYVYPLQFWVKDGSADNKSDLVLRRVNFMQCKITSLSPLNKLVRREL